MIQDIAIIATNRLNTKSS